MARLSEPIISHFILLRPFALPKKTLVFYDGELEDYARMGGIRSPKLICFAADSPSMFSIRLNYGGVFTKFSGRKYINGKMKYIDGIDSDLFSVHDMDGMMKLLDCMEPGKSIYYHFKRPTWDLDFGLYALGCDEDINHFRSYIYKHKVIEVYTEFWETKLHTYEMSPNPTKIKIHELKKLNSEAYDRLNSIPPKHWSRSHFSGRAHCDTLLNNMCESLNSKIVMGRDKPIISCLEFIREYIMSKIVMVQKEIDKANGPLTLTTTKTLQKIKEKVVQRREVFYGNGKCQVTREGTN
uniref:PB1-like domain-containing protein n=1 Tax=Lactuca sativa TaxID=4236 RepID=A0A9R1UH29_LACSA|nr:hypothetical protein LSAT_V11C900482450 [Lactuca sativa]